MATVIGGDGPGADFYPGFAHLVDPTERFALHLDEQVRDDPETLIELFEGVIYVAEIPDKEVWDVVFKAHQDYREHSLEDAQATAPEIPQLEANLLLIDAFDILDILYDNHRPEYDGLAEHYWWMSPEYAEMMAPYSQD